MASHAGVPHDPRRATFSVTKKRTECFLLRNLRCVPGGSGLPGPPSFFGVPMEIKIELWHFISLIVMFIGAVWAMAKLAMAEVQRGLDERFKAVNDTLSMMAAEVKEIHRIDKEILKLRAEIASEYLRSSGFDEFRREFRDNIRELFAQLRRKVDRDDCAHCGSKI